MVRKTKEEQRMNTLKRVLIFMFLTGMILGVTGLLYGAEVGGGGNAWDSCSDCYCFDNKAHGTKIPGTLSIYYKARTNSEGNYTGDYETYLTLRLEDKKQLYVYREMGDIVSDPTIGTGFMACNFILDVISKLFPGKVGAVKSIENAWGTYEDEPTLHSRAFVVDMTIVVQE
jgi:hypothetical protein